MNIKTHTYAPNLLGQRLEHYAGSVIAHIGKKRSRIARHEGRRHLRHHAFVIDFNQVILPVMATDTPQDILKRYLDIDEARQKALDSTPERIAQRAAEETSWRHRKDRAQSDTNELIAALPTTVKGPLPELMEWVSRFASAAGWSSIKYDAAKVQTLFNEAGYQEGEFVGEHHREVLNTVPAAMGRFVIGQFLEFLSLGSGFPDMLELFINSYRKMVTTSA